MFAGDKCSGAVLPNRSGEAIAGNDQVSALTQSRYHVHGQNNRSGWLRLVIDGEVRSGSLPGGEWLITHSLVVICIRRSVQGLRRKSRDASGKYFLRS